MRATQLKIQASSAWADLGLVEEDRARGSIPAAMKAAAPSRVCRRSLRGLARR
jgi:hypothetical protein